MLERPSADSEEKHEPVSDIDTAPMEGLKALDPKRPIREADMCVAIAHVLFGPIADILCRYSGLERCCFSRVISSWDQPRTSVT